MVWTVSYRIEEVQYEKERNDRVEQQRRQIERKDKKEHDERERIKRLLSSPDKSTSPLKLGVMDSWASRRGEM